MTENEKQHHNHVVHTGIFLKGMAVVKVNLN